MTKLGRPLKIGLLIAFVAAYFLWHFTSGGAIQFSLVSFYSQF